MSASSPDANTGGVGVTKDAGPMEDGAGIAPELARPQPPPDGGMQAWMQVSAAFCLTWNSLYVLRV